eukprot:CAMPEP_0180796626 /NCGR_PEP_ID=MMETSP1038_2-20121128/56900_1 /TAXON_ID=632150 /ORGANISM="Azadinium spinosum, Strain 3D9" /LENGTH=49 /DNA_ID= /DNA_START= /DNA_END= /DNA_ORIENTATION=
MTRVTTGGSTNREMGSLVTRFLAGALPFASNDDTFKRREAQASFDLPYT